MKINIYIVLLLFTYCNSLFAQEIKDKTNYYAKDMENFNNYSSNGWDLLEDKQL